MKIGIKVGDVMTKRFTSVKPDTSIFDCIKTMKDKNIGSLIIKKEDNLVGILTEGDIVNAIARKKNFEKMKASDVMTKKVVTINPEKDMYDALEAMKKRKIRWLPVTFGAGKRKIMGLLTVKDILRIEPSLFDAFIENAEIREEAAKLKAAEVRRKTQTGLRSETLWAKEGECEECEAFGPLYNIDGKMICEDCRDEISKD